MNEKEPETSREYHPSEQQVAHNQRAFQYHSPKPDQIPRYGTLRQQAAYLAADMIRLCPQSRELSLALTKLQEATMWANASIACNE
jgi:hypothetical protein